MDILLIRFEAPMMSFGAPIVDNNGFTQDFPALSMLTGLLGNALGYDHSEHERLERLQARIRYAVRRDRTGTQLRDYQTVDLGQDFLLDERAWTTRHALQERAGAAGKSTHIRFRYYWADAAYTIALTLDDGDGPTMTSLREALEQPERPLFIGRKTCLPAAPLMMELVREESLLNALRTAPLPAGENGDRRHAWWEIDPDEVVANAMIQSVSDRRDWKNQIHAGERWLAHGDIDVEPTRSAQ